MSSVGLVLKMEKVQVQKYSTLCAFDELFKRNVPHLLEKIFFNLDYKSFKECLEVSNAWNELLTSAPFLKKGKRLYRLEILRDESLLLIESATGNIHMVRKLLYNGMLDVNMTNWNRMTPLMVATRHGHNGVVKLLLDRGADPDRVNEYRCTALHFAVIYSFHSRRRLDIVKQLVDGKADLGITNADGWTPLHSAVRSRNKYAVKILMDNGADLNQTDESGQTPLSLAQKMGFQGQDMVDILTK